MTVSVVGHDPVAAPEDERTSLQHLADLLAQREGRAVDILPAEGEPAELPPTAVRLLREIVEILARGESAVIASLGPEVSPVQGANLLVLPEDYLNRLLDEGAVPSTGAGLDRRIKLSDLLAYRHKEDVHRREAMTDLIRLSEEFGLYEWDAGEAATRSKRKHTSE